MEVMRSKPNHPERLIVYLGMACIFATFLLAVARVHPESFFGYTEDDSIYFSSAKALAEGNGYILESFPGHPAATKYPILYPWLLSWVWRWNPSFPSNLTDAIAVNVSFGIAFLGLSFLLFQCFRPMRNTEALLLTGLCAMHPLVIFFSGSLQSEMLFAALGLASLLLADYAMRPFANIGLAVMCGALVGISMMVRFFAVPIAAGIITAAIWRRARPQLLAFATALMPFFGGLCWKAIFPELPKSPVSGPLVSSLAWIHTWTYYTSYINVWRQGVPTFAIFLSVLKNNALFLVTTPALYFLYPLVSGQGAIQRVAVIILTLASLVGLWREARRSEFRPLHFALPFYAMLILVWNYPQADRFLLPFLPIFAAGIWLEFKHIFGLCRSVLFSRANPTAPSSAPEKVCAVGLLTTLTVFTAAILVNYLGGRSLWSNLSKNRTGLLEEKLEAYAWIKKFAPSGACVVAYEDASLYLYTDRQSIRPFVFTTAEFFDPSRLEADLNHLDDVPSAIGAQYWLSSDDDYSFEWPQARRAFQARMKVTAAHFPIVFRSSRGHVRIYLLTRFQHSGADDSRIGLSTFAPYRHNQLVRKDAVKFIPLSLTSDTSLRTLAIPHVLRSEFANQPLKINDLRELIPKEGLAN